MPSPFPGMDPYLETPELWSDVHLELLSQIRLFLNPRLRPKYVARVESRVYISDDDDPGRKAIVPDIRIEKRKSGRRGKSAESGRIVIAEPIVIPYLIDNEIEEAYLTIKDRQSGALVTLIEVLSPTNKIRGSEGRKSFLQKKKEVMASEVSWVEIDLLRAGDPSVISPPLRPCDYRILVWRASEKYDAYYWPITIRQQLPTFGIPLRPKDSDVQLDLSAVLKTVYDNAEYDASIDYSKPADPPLNRDDAKWANKLLRTKGLR